MILDRVKESSTSSGTGDIVLNGAETGFYTFTEKFLDGESAYIFIVDTVTGDWEACTATYFITGNKLTRGTLHSSSTGNRVLFAGNLMAVFVQVSAEQMVYAEDGAIVLPSGTLLTISQIEGLSANLSLILSTASTDASTKAATAQAEAIAASAIDATTKANSAQSAAIAASAIDATTKANSAQLAAISTAAIDATTKADTAQSAAISTAAADATAKANAAQSAAIAAASADASTKASDAQTSAIAAAATDATTKANAAQAAAQSYADAISQGIDAKASCRLATTTNIASLTGLFSVDGVTPTSGQRILVKNQTASAQNGIYIASALAWTRSTDMDIWTEIPGAFTFIEAGTVNAGTGWTAIASSTGTIGTTAIPFVQFSGAGTYTASNGVTLSGTQFSIDNLVVATLSDSQTLTNKTIDGTLNTFSNVPNNALTNNKLTINGVDVSLGGSINVGTVTSIDVSVPTGLSVAGNPITGSGTLAISMQSGYSIPQTSDMLNWETAYSQTLQWGGGATNLVPETARGSLGLVIGSDVQPFSLALESWAGKSAPSGAVVGDYDTQWLTNKRITPRVVSITSASSVTPTSDTADQYQITALAETATFAIPNGTPVDGQRLIIRIKDNGVARVLSWTTTSGGYRAMDTPLPTITSAGKTYYIGLIYNSASEFWDAVAIAQEA